MKRFCFLMLVFILAACNREVEKPHDLISRGEMKQIVGEIYVYRQTPQVDPKQSAMQNLDEVNMAVLQEHNVSLDQFKRSYKYYVLENKGYGEFLHEVKDSLEGLLPKEALKQEKQQDKPKPNNHAIKKPSGQKSTKIENEPNKKNEIKKKYVPSIKPDKKPLKE